jgi:hypothetical protein
MSAALVLDFSGPPARCDFPRCILDAFHDGDHEFPSSAPKPLLCQFDQHCVVCGAPFVVYGAERAQVFSTCGSPQCVLHFARHNQPDVPLLCPCLQRSYPHELHIHNQLRSESYNPKLKQSWPWSLVLSPRLEFSAERKAGAA